MNVRLHKVASFETPNSLLKRGTGSERLVGFFSFFWVAARCLSSFFNRLPSKVKRRRKNGFEPDGPAKISMRTSCRPGEYFARDRSFLRSDASAGVRFGRMDRLFSLDSLSSRLDFKASLVHERG